MGYCKNKFKSKRVWSLWDMLRFYAAAFSSSLHNLQISRDKLLVIACGYEQIDVNVWEELENNLVAVRDGVSKLPLSYSLQKQLERALDRAKKRDTQDIEYLSTVLNELAHNITAELGGRLFLVIPEDLKVSYLKPETITGTEFETVFPDAVKDARNGIRCHALDQWTASVFHLMRVLEHGLRWFGSRVGLNMETISLENWKVIIDQIEKKIREMEQLPKSTQKNEEIKFYSEAAANFRFFKDAWRNHVSHSRVHYDSTDAQRVMDHVLEFMKHLAIRADNSK